MKLYLAKNNDGWITVHLEKPSRHNEIVKSNEIYNKWWSSSMNYGMIRFKVEHLPFSLSKKEKELLSNMSFEDEPIEIHIDLNNLF